MSGDESLRLPWSLPDYQARSTDLSSVDNDDNDQYLLAFPDPFATDVPPSARPTNRTFTATNSSNSASADIIDLTDSPPQAHRPATATEVIDLDAIPDIRPRPVMPHRHPSPVDRAARDRYQSEARMAMYLNSTPGSGAQSNNAGGGHTSRREWLLQQARARADARDQRIAVQQDLRERQAEVARVNMARGAPGMFFNSNFMANIMNGDFSEIRHLFQGGPGAAGSVNYRVNPLNVGVPSGHGGPGGHGPVPPRFNVPNPNYALYNPEYAGYTEPPAPPAFKYVKPDPPKEPFTRTYGESDVLVCPACKSELGGTGSETKRRIFISKCSHVYCGDCGLEIKRAAKGRGIKCHAPSCGKGITKTRIFEAYV